MGLLDWLRSKPKCPINVVTRRWVEYRWTWLEEQFGVEMVRKTPVILPQAKFFPDQWRETEDDACRMLDRVCGYMNLDPNCVVMSLYDDNDQSPVFNQAMFDEEWQGSAGMYSQEYGKFRIWIHIANLNDPLAMVATIAHELGHVHLLGHRRISEYTEDHEPLTDLLTVFFGMGVITANAVIREQNWEEGSYVGWKIGRQGYLAMPTFGYALARFARTRGEDGATWSRELRPDVRSAFKQAMKFLSAEKVGPESDSA